MSHFPFINQQILRSNLDLTFIHIIDLLALSESESYKNKKAFVSSLRKTVIINTASIIEALLLWKLKQVSKAKTIKLSNKWKYFEIKQIYKINDSQEAIAGLRKLEQKNIDKLDFLRITDLCQKHNILRSEILRKNIDKVRKLRNRMHIGGLKEIEKRYTNKDLELCFKVFKKIKKLCSK